MDYRIISADATIGQIQITYVKDGVDIATYAYDVPIENGAFITGERLDAEIRKNAPTWVTERSEQVKNAINFDLIQDLVQAPRKVETPADLSDLTPEQRANQLMWDDFGFEQRVCNVLTKYNLMASNPTYIDVTKL